MAMGRFDHLVLRLRLTMPLTAAGTARQLAESWHLGKTLPSFVDRDNELVFDDDPLLVFFRNDGENEFSLIAEDQSGTRVLISGSIRSRRNGADNEAIWECCGPKNERLEVICRN